MEYNIQNTISYTDFFLYFSSIHIPPDCNEDYDYIEQSDLQSYWSYNELISDEFFDNSNYSYINLINYRKLREVNLVAFIPTNQYVEFVVKLPVTI